MCGIFALLNNDENFTPVFQKKQFEKGRARGPEDSSLSSVNVQTIFGFHRLAINGLNPESSQPLRYNDISLICNGEIYNYRELYDAMDIEPETESDCEVIIHLYLKYGIEHTLQMLDGVFAFVLMDARLNLPRHKIYVARDPYGVRPLFWLRNSVPNSFMGFASELKSLSDFYTELLDEPDYILTPFEPGHLVEFELPWIVSPRWTLARVHKYHSTGFSSIISLEGGQSELSILSGICKYLKAAVFKRCSATDRPIACLLSGGLDSSLITAIVSEYHRITGLSAVETYSIGLEGSEDLRYAKQVASYLGTKHTEIILTEQDFIDAVPDVIRAIESYDTTTVRASIGNWLLGKYIAAHSEAKVIFNGDGSDELCGGYLYMHKCPDAIEFDRESRRLLKDIHYFDVLRSDRSISSHGLEPRTPFLDRSWVQYYLAIPVNMRFHPFTGKQEKWLLRSAFANMLDSRGLPILPSEVLWRRKEAFSDGVSMGTRSLYQILQEHAANLPLGVLFENSDHNPPTTAEQRWYRGIFEKEYSGLAKVIPYFWMPSYVDAKDASARTLAIYY